MALGFGVLLKVGLANRDGSVHIGKLGEVCGQRKTAGMPIDSVLKAACHLVTGAGHQANEILRSDRSSLGIVVDPLLAGGEALSPAVELKLTHSDLQQPVVGKLTRIAYLQPSFQSILPLATLFVKLCLTTQCRHLTYRQLQHLTL